MRHSSLNAAGRELKALEGSLDRRQIQLVVQLRETGESMSEAVERSSGERAVFRAILHVTRRGAGRRVSLFVACYLHSRASKPLASKRRDERAQGRLGRARKQGLKRRTSIGGRNSEGAMDGSRDTEKEAKSLSAENIPFSLQRLLFAKTSAGKKRSTRHYLRDAQPVSQVSWTPDYQRDVSSVVRTCFLTIKRERNQQDSEGPSSKMTSLFGVLWCSSGMAWSTLRSLGQQDLRKFSSDA
ncbi:hypothetical protein DFH07DRAFT_852556 [Mycena maculata]|uniref:Uncharacterized protein n=1 Tax=Mycena maculata TaxID=230809 RepID=A0AAD7HSQ8_9AGAR|nr:hypothetical protein DFH07DRAFT_852556 [Mycena maculata]